MQTENPYESPQSVEKAKPRAIESIAEWILLVFSSLAFGTGVLVIIGYVLYIIGAIVF